MKYWRQQGLRAVVYLDDGILAVEGEHAVAMLSRMIWLRQAYSCACYQVLQPTQQCTWLGFDINLVKGCILVPETKLNNLLLQVAHAVNCKSMQTRALASLVGKIYGKIISMSLAIGPVARPMTRNLYVVLSSHQAWCENLELSTDAKSELQFWACELPKLNGH